MIRITDIVERAILRLPCQFGPDTNMSKLLVVLASPIQALADDIWGLAEALPIENSTGGLLDRWGELFAIDRGGYGDDEYRAHILARAAADASSGRVEDLLKVLTILIPLSTDIRVMEGGQATITINYVISPATTPQIKTLIKSMIASAKSAGVQIEMIVEANTAYFGFAEDPHALGFDQGKLAEVI